MTFGLIIGIAVICLAILGSSPEFQAAWGFTVHNLVDCRAVACAGSPNHHGPPGSYSPPLSITLCKTKKSYGPFF